MISFITRFGWLLTAMLFVTSAYSQVAYQITGRITDIITGVGIPYATIGVRGTTVGTVSDENGHYKLQLLSLSDSLIISSLGYRNGSARLGATVHQTINVALVPSSQNLGEVRVYTKGGDPAYRIVREAVHRRKNFDPNQLAAYQHQSYTKIEAYLNDFTTPANGRKKGLLARQLAKLPAIKDPSGQPAVPVLVSETYSTFFYRSKPNKVREHVLKSRSVGVGLTDGSLVAQLSGASFQQYNFYDPYVSVLRKDLPSPLGQPGQTLYTFRLVDTVLVDSKACYQISFEPKQTADLAFTGTLWIDTTRYGLAQIEASINRRANINFLDAFQLNQIWQDVDDSTLTQPTRLPVQTQVVLDLQSAVPNAPGVLVRFYSAASNPAVGSPREVAFYEPALELADDFRQDSVAFWQRVRPEDLRPDEFRAIDVVDSVRNTPLMKTVGGLVRLMTAGYYQPPTGPLDAGPLLSSYAYNTVEGHRLRVGLRTNAHFSRRWVLTGYAAYGFRDKPLKYGVGLEYIASKKPWTVFGLQHRYDLEQLGLTDENRPTNPIFAAYTRFGTLRRPYRQESTYAYVKHQWTSRFHLLFGLRSQTFEPLYPFAFLEAGIPSRHLTYFRSTELVWETRFAPGELQLRNDNERIAIGASNQPVISFRYRLGLRALASDFDYHNLNATLRQSFRMGVLGRTTYQVTGGAIVGQLPYPLLYIPLGNQTTFRLDNAYNLMNYFEFTMDRYVGIQLEHNFEGLLFNRIPTIQRLKWRFLVTGKALWGSISSDNQALSPLPNQSRYPAHELLAPSRIPYVEVGYGIDNIFRVLRIDALHRLTYRSADNAQRFGIRISAWVNL